MMIPTSNNLNVYWFIRIPVASSLFDCPDHRRSLGGQSITSRLPLVPSWDCHGAVPNLEENWPRCRGMTWFPTTSWESRNCVTPPRYPRIGTFGWENQWFAKLLFFCLLPIFRGIKGAFSSKGWLFFRLFLQDTKRSHWRLGFQGLMNVPLWGVVHMNHWMFGGDNILSI